jgi:subtilisin family serine protease
MRLRTIIAVAAVLALAIPISAAAAPEAGRRTASRAEGGLPKGFEPAVLSLDRVGRYFVELKAAPLADRIQTHTLLGTESETVSRVFSSQNAAIADVQSRGGTVLFRYARLVNAFSALMTGRDAMEIANRPDVVRVEAVPIVVRENETSVPFIGAPKVWKKLGVKGQGMTVAIVDTGIDYTHADFGGPGTPEAYADNDPSVIEPGTFPTSKVIGGYDFVGSNYDVLDADTSNDVPVPDPDPLDKDGHGTHTAGTCCGIGVPGSVGKGVAPKAKLLAVKVWDVGNSTADVLVAGYEFAMDPNQDGNTKDAADVLSFSGGVDYGPGSSVEAEAAQSVVDLGTVFVASAGNAGNQPTGGSAYILGTPASAPGVIGVAASIDQFVAQTLSVNAPSGVTLTDSGLMVWQDWSGELTADVTADVVDARAVVPPADPDGVPAPTDRMLCDTTPTGAPFAGKIALVYKGATGAGDCTGSEKVFRAQEAGAIAVILWNGFGGYPSALGPGDFVDQITVPAVMLSTADSETLGQAASPDAPGSYNTGGLNVTLNVASSIIPGFADRMTDFTSEGPARITSALKPDISAPGFDITSAAVGTGDGAATFSGTSMACPHVSGVATLLRQIHPNWTPAQIKAALMNQATLDMANNDGTAPVPATVMGSGRVQAWESATAVTLATPGSLSFKFQPVGDLTTIVKTIKVKNLDSRAHQYDATGSVRYNDFTKKFASVMVAVNGGNLKHSVSLSLAPKEKAEVQVELTLDPSKVPAWQQEYGWYYFNPNVDGTIEFTQSGGSKDTFHVPWHVAPLAASGTGLSKSSLDLTGGSATVKLTGSGAGLRAADLYLLGAESGKDQGDEGDIAQVGIRSFTGPTIDGVAHGIPTGTDALAGITWQQFLTATDEPTEPIEFGVRSFGLRNTTETLEVDVAIDVGADGVFADDTLMADYLVVKLAGFGGNVCVFDLSLPSPFDACAETYYADYSNYNSNLVGLPVDVGALGLSSSTHTIAYGVVTATGVFSGDVPAYTFDSVGEIDPATGTYDLTFDVTNPPLAITPLVCRGFFGGGACSASSPIEVSVGSAAPGDDPSILGLFPNDPPSSSGVVISTST